MPYLSESNKKIIAGLYDSVNASREMTVDEAIELRMVIKRCNSLVDIRYAEEAYILELLANHQMGTPNPVVPECFLGIKHFKLTDSERHIRITSIRDIIRKDERYERLAMRNLKAALFSFDNVETMRLVISAIHCGNLISSQSHVVPEFSGQLQN